MNSIRTIVFRYLTAADFFHINKPTGTEVGGGGQSYIDFPTTDIDIPEWENFFNDIIDLRELEGRTGPTWQFPIYSIGLPREMNQQLKVYQRRGASVSIAAQKIDSRRSNRVRAWHPRHGFPVPANPNGRNQLPQGLAVYLVKTKGGEVWAGWFQHGEMPSSDKGVLNHLSKMLTERQEGDAEMLDYGSGELMLNEKDRREAFSLSNSLKPPTGAAAAAHLKRTKLSGGTGAKARIKKKTARIIPKMKGRFSQIKRSEEEIIDSLFSEDSNYPDSGNKIIMRKQTRIRKRNQRAVADLKELYEHTCQISGTKYLFRKKDGTYYTEAHHLVPLGEGGADSPLNIVILSPLIHRMLHYADVQNVDLSKIKTNPDGSAQLDILINKKKSTISWKRGHSEMIVKFHREH